MSTTDPKLTPRQQAILSAVSAAGRPITGPGLARVIGEHPSTIGNMLDRLVLKGAVEIHHVAPPARGGRPCAHYVPVGFAPRWTPRPDPAAAWLFVDPAHVGGLWHAA